MELTEDIRCKKIFDKGTLLRNRLYAWELDHLEYLNQNPMRQAELDKATLFVKTLLRLVPLSKYTKEDLMELNSIWVSFDLKNQSANGNQRD